MKKVMLLIISSLICFSIEANPLVAPFPPIINEIYFDSNENWTIEFKTTYYTFINFDVLSIETSAGISFLKPGLTPTDSIVVITIDSLLTPLYINPQGDFIKIHTVNNMFESENYFYFGDFVYSYISSINHNQSYEIQLSPCGFFYYFAKQNYHTIGYTNNLPASSGTFTGYIVDGDLLPISNIKIACEITSYNYETHSIYDSMNYDVSLYCHYMINSDGNGYFVNNILQGRNYFLNFYSGDGNYLYDTTIAITIEPDSINNYLFVLDCDQIFVGIDKTELPEIELRNYPNPGSDLITISCRTVKTINGKNAVIKIFTYDGDLIKILPVSISELCVSSEINVVCDFSNYTQGNYYYNLEIDGKKLGSNQIVVVK